MPSYDSTANTGPSLVILGWSLLAVSSAVVILRMYTSLTRLRRLYVADYLMLASLISEIVHTVFVTLAVEKGLGRHFATLSRKDQQMSLFYIIGFCEVFAIITCMFGRISFAVFLLYIIGPTDIKKKVALWSVIAIQVVVTAVTLIQIYTQCGNHVAALWDYKVAIKTTCQSPVVQTMIGYVQSSLNSLCDVALTILPALVLWKLNMPLGQKLGLGACLTLSVFAFAASVVKAIAIHTLAERNDFTWAMTTLQIWVIVENSVVMVAASIPTLRPLLRKRSGSSQGTPKAYNYTSHSRRKEYIRDPYSLPPDTKMESAGQGGHDGSSEEYILEIIPTDEEQQIMKTTEVCFAYETISEAALHDAENRVINPYQRDLIGPWTGPDCPARPSIAAGS